MTDEPEEPVAYVLNAETGIITAVTTPTTVPVVQPKPESPTQKSPNSLNSQENHRGGLQ